MSTQTKPNIKPGIYRHYKGNLYRVIGTGKHSENLEDLVFYEALYDNPESKLWARPLKIFAGKVEIDGIIKSRFKYIGGTKIGYTHIAIFKWKPGTSQETINVILQAIEALQDKVPGICEISTGENQSKYSEGYTHVILVRGENKEAIEAYRNHPDHRVIAEKIETIEEHGIGADL